LAKFKKLNTNLAYKLCDVIYRSLALRFYYLSSSRMIQTNATNFNRMSSISSLLSFFLSFWLSFFLSFWLSFFLSFSHTHTHGIFPNTRDPNYRVSVSGISKLLVISLNKKSFVFTPWSTPILFQISAHNFEKCSLSILCKLNF